MLRMSDIAARAGVSASTVSLVLNDRHVAVRISEATRQKVLGAANEMGYRVNHQARAMRTSNTRTIGIVGGDLCSEQVGGMLSGILEEVNRQDYTLKILPAQGDEGQRQMIRRASELRVMGVVGLHLSTRMIEEFRVEAQSCNYPLVLLDTYDSFTEVPQVVSDDENGVSAVVDHLRELGHGRIAMVSGAGNSALTPLREAAFEAAMARCKLDVPRGFIARGDYVEPAPSVQAVQRLLSLPPATRPTALFCGGDLIALAALQVARGMKLEVPRDLSIVGFADMSVAAFASPALTTVHQPFRDMGRLAARRLLEASADENLCPECEEIVSHRRESFELLPTRFIERQTTGPAPTQTGMRVASRRISAS